MPQTIFLSFAVMSWVVASVVFPIIAGYWIGDFVDERFFEGTSRSTFGVLLKLFVALFTFSVVVVTGYEIVKDYKELTSGLPSIQGNDMSRPFLFLIWSFLPMVIIALLTKKFAESYLREAKAIINIIVSSIVALTIFAATFGGIFVGIYINSDGNLNGDGKPPVESTETVEKLAPSLEELEDK